MYKTVWACDICGKEKRFEDIALHISIDSKTKRRTVEVCKDCSQKVLEALKQ
jgi:hypothetical protein